MKKLCVIVTFLLLFLTGQAQTAPGASPKREFRGAWLHVIGQTQYARMSTGQAQEYIASQIETLHKAGCNAVIFQVRPCADALYVSELEPWSQYLTGRRGKAPSPLWDPMAFAIEEAHRHGMEFHAWLNPYRISTNASEVLPESHIARREPWRTFKYDNKLFFDPGIPENIDYIAQVVSDIVTRYDVDAIHMDDYFYPYPSAGGGRFNADAATYKKYGNGIPLADWRRQNVNKLIETLHDRIRAAKPWVRFGISPFGIWRNKRTDPRGSESTGLQNYDDLYADVILWAKNGWIDYMAPQLYWELDTRAAPSRKLVRWWSDNANGCYVFVGQDTKRTMDKADAPAHQRSELKTKVELGRSLPGIHGNVWWHGYWVTGNYKGVRDSLTNDFQSVIALPPAYGDRKVSPAKPSHLKLSKKDGVYYLTWTPPAPAAKPSATDPTRFVVYEFFPNEKPDTGNPQTIITVTPYHTVSLGDKVESGTTFMVTTLDRMNRESSPARVSAR